MEYIVIRAFTDKNDKHHYAVGERYPYRGFAKKERLEELSSKHNKRGVPLIEAVKTKVEKPKKAETTDKPEKAETKKKSAKKND